MLETPEQLRPPVHTLKVVRSEKTKSIAHREILDKLLAQIPKVDFKEVAELSNDEKVQKKHFVVYAIEAILETAKTNGWQLCRNNGQTFIYNGAYWKAIDRDLLQNFFGKAAEALGVPQADAKFYLFRNDLLKQFEATAIYRPPKEQTGLP